MPGSENPGNGQVLRMPYSSGHDAGVIDEDPSDN